MVRTTFISVQWLLYFFVLWIHCSDCLWFKTDFKQHVRIRVSEEALLTWRVLPEFNDFTDIAPIYECGYLQYGTKTNLIRRVDDQNPQVQAESIFRNRIQSYVDAGNQKIFGFKITGVFTTDPTKFICTASFARMIGGNIVDESIISPVITLEVVGIATTSQVLTTPRNTTTSRILTTSRNTNRSRISTTSSITTTSPVQITPRNTTTRRILTTSGITTTSQVLTTPRNTTTSRILTTSRNRTANRLLATPSITSSRQTLISTPRFTSVIRNTDTIASTRSFPSIVSSAITSPGTPEKPLDFHQYFPYHGLCTSIYLQWRPIHVYGHVVNHYKVHYFMRSEPAFDGYWGVDYPPIVDGFVKFELKYLRPGVKYTVQVYDVNQYHSKQNYAEIEVVTCSRNYH